MKDIKYYYQNNKLFIFSIFVVAIFFCFDLGNINAIRQGTEGFYLQISKEMFEAGNIQVPLYKGLNHWSKPPLHFWAANIIYYFTGAPSLFASRLYIVLLSLFALIFYANWCNRYFNISKHITLLSFATCIGILKYSRIYMMEAPLSILTFCAILKYFDFINEGKRGDLFKASLLLAAAALVKGPVSLAMAFISVGLFLVYLRVIRVKIDVSTYIAWFIISVGLSSIWFFLCFYDYGMEFINYFFVKENWGKFLTQAYPVRVLFQGLAIYSIPALFFFPLSLKYFYDKKSLLFSKHPSKKEQIFVFLIISFCVYFFIWFIPTQRSHHYAIPALPIFIMIIFLSSMEFLKENKFSKFAKYLYHMGIGISYVLMLTLFVAMCVVLYLVPFSGAQTSIYIYSSIFLVAASLLLFLRKCYFSKVMAFFIAFSSAWAIFYPTITFNELDPRVKAIVKEHQVKTTLRKFYFLSQELEKEVEHIPRFGLIQHLNNGSLAISNDIDLEGIPEEQYTVVLSWRVWKRRLKFSDLLDALKQRDLSSVTQMRNLLSK